MKHPMRAAVLFAILFTVGLGCADKKQQQTTDLGHLDSEVSSDLGSSVPDTAVAADTLVCETPGPVKVMLLVDTSGSMQFTDPDHHRHDAVKALIDGMVDRPEVTFSIASFNSVVHHESDSKQPLAYGLHRIFTNNSDHLMEQVRYLHMGELKSDIQGGLLFARHLLEADMSMTSDAERSATRYVLVLITDGGRNVVCQAGCDNDAMDDARDAECSGGACGMPPLPEYSWCDIPRDEWCSAFNVTSSQCDMESWFGELHACQEYNSERTVREEVDKLLALRQTFEPAALELHTVRILAELDEELHGSLKVNPEADRQLLQDLADVGGGGFLDHTAGLLDLLPALVLLPAACAPDAELDPPAAGECNFIKTPSEEDPVPCGEGDSCESTPSRPYCHPTYSYCMECLEDNHCQGQEGISRCLVYPTYGRCVECLDDADCTAGEGRTGFCDGNRTCSGCYGNADCQASGEGGYCLRPGHHFFKGRCVQCLNDEHCEPGSANTGRCSTSFGCLGCDQHAECAATFPEQQPPISCTAEAL